MIRISTNFRRGTILTMVAVLAVLTVGNPTVASAQNSGEEPVVVEKPDGKHQQLEERFMMHFRWDKTTFDPNYLSNPQELARLRAFIDSVDVKEIEKVEMYSYASPEGVYEHNIRLSKDRSNTMKAYMESNFPDLTSRLSVDPRGESWDELREYVMNDQNLKEESKAAILKIIDTDINVGTKKWRLERTGSYKYLYKTYYPLIRNTGMLVVRYKKHPEPDPIVIPEPEPEPEIVVVAAPAPEPEPIRAKETIFALKTNLLYDVASMLNAEIEFPIWKCFSIAVEDVFPWWEFKTNKYALQNWEMGVEARYWFKHWDWDTTKILGHFIGAYGMSGRGDLQIDTKPNYQAHYWSAGLTYGYVMPLGKNHWGNLEFSISAGMLRSDYQHYWPATDYSKLIRDPYESGRITYFGPTKAKISLVIPINFYTRRASEIATRKLKEAASDNE